MALLGQAALAMWWDIAPAVRAEFEDWHTHEHFPERLGVPGFLRSSRWTDSEGGDGVFVLYELENRAVLSSPAYLARLNAPSPWSTKLMPHHRNMVRSQDHVLASRGAAIARHLVTVRLSPASEDHVKDLHAGVRALIERLVVAPGLSGAHLLQHRTPDIAQTTEQKIRGSSDRTADWIFLVCGYDRLVLDGLSATVFSAEALQQLGAGPDQVRGTYALSSSATPSDIG